MPTPARKDDGVAWITGASSGIGRALALRLARDGWRVVGTARGEDALREVAAESGGRIVPMAGDISDAAGIAAVVRRIEAEVGPIALAVLNAGVYQPLKGDDFDLDLFRRTIEINTIGTANALSAVLAVMKPRRRGQIAVVSSVAGYSGLPAAGAYGASKAALINMAEALKFDTDRMGIHLQLVSPGFVETPLTAKNAFEMPFLVPIDRAVERMVKGLASRRFEIAFPTPFVLILKALRLLPYRLYFAVVGRNTGWK